MPALTDTTLTVPYGSDVLGETITVTCPIAWAGTVHEASALCVYGPTWSRSVAAALADLAAQPTDYRHAILVERIKVAQRIKH